MTGTFWNVVETTIITGVATGVILFFINRLFAQRDRKDEQIAILVKQQEDAVRKDAADARKHTFDALREITATLAQKVPWDHCTERRKQRDAEVSALECAAKLAEISDTKNDYLHATLTASLETIRGAIQENTDNDIEVRDVLFDKLSTIDVSLKLINGSVRDTKEALAIHIVKGHGL